MKRYQGMRVEGKTYVVVIDSPNPVVALRHVGRHALTSRLDWGGESGACKDLALSILDDAAGRDVAVDLYLRYCREVVTRLQEKSFDIGEDSVLGWISEQNKKAA